MLLLAQLVVGFAVVLLPGALVARALGVRRLSATIAWALVVFFAALAVTFLVSASLDKTVRVWDAGSGRLLAVLRGHDEAVLAVDLDWGRERVVSGSADRTLRLWAIEGGSEVRTLTGDEDFLSCVAFDPSGRIVAAASCSTFSPMSPSMFSPWPPTGWAAPVLVPGAIAA